MENSIKLTSDIIKIINILSDGLELLVTTIILEDVLFDGIELSYEGDGFRLLKWSQNLEYELDSDEISREDLLLIRGQLEKLL